MSRSLFDAMAGGIVGACLNVFIFTGASAFLISACIGLGVALALFEFSSVTHTFASSNYSLGHQGPVQRASDTLLTGDLTFTANASDTTAASAPFSNAIQHDSQKTNRVKIGLDTTL